jgi:DNA-binding HxlR family transcriptional regulator
MHDGSSHRCPASRSLFAKRPEQALRIREYQAGSRLPVSLPAPKMVIMGKPTDNSDRDQKIDELIKKHRKLDDTCVEIFLTLMAYKRLRFNRLHDTMKMFRARISKPSLIDHLEHLRKQKLISRKREGFQTVSYGLTDEVTSLLTAPDEDIRKWLEIHIEEKNLPKNRRTLRPFDTREYYDRLSEEHLDKAIDKDLDRVFLQNLFELRTFINYDLKLDRRGRDAEFWQLVGNPLYRLLEKSIVENCRSEKYRQRLFERIDAQVERLKHQPDGNH